MLITAPTKDAAAGAQTSNSSPHAPKSQSVSLIAGHLSSKSLPTHTPKMTKIPKGPERYGICPRCKSGHKIRKLNNPRGKGPHAGQWSFACSNRRGSNPCRFYELLDGDPLIKLQQRYQHQAAHKQQLPHQGEIDHDAARQEMLDREQRFEEQLLQEQLENELEQEEHRAASPVLSSGRMESCPQCRRGHLIEQETTTAAYTGGHLECSRRRAQEGPRCNYQRLILSDGAHSGNTASTAGRGDSQTTPPEVTWDALSYIAAVPANPAKKPGRLIDLTADSDGEDRPLVMRSRKVPQQAGQDSPTKKDPPNSQPRAAQRSLSQQNRGKGGSTVTAKGPNRVRQIVNLDDYEDEEDPQVVWEAGVGNKHKRRKISAQHEEFEVDSDLDSELIKMADRASKQPGKRS